MFVVALVAPKWPIFKKHITSWHDLVVFSIGMEFVAYLGNHNNGQRWPNMVPTVGTDSSTRTPCKAGVILSPSYQRKRCHNFTCLPVSVSLIPKLHWASLLPKALSATQIHSRQKMSSTESRKPWFQNRDSLKSFQSRQENYFKEASKKNC